MRDSFMSMMRLNHNAFIPAMLTYRNCDEPSVVIPLYILNNNNHDHLFSPHIILSVVAESRVAKGQRGASRKKSEAKKISTVGKQAKQTLKRSYKAQD